MGNSAWGGGGVGGGAPTPVPWVDIKKDWGAKGDGVSDDGPNFMNFNAWGRLQTQGIRLVIPPGTYHIVSGSNAWWLNGIADLIVDGYGATIDRWYNGSGFYQDNVHSALVQNVNANDTVVTVVNLSDAARFIVGNWICLMCFDVQGSFSFPPNPVIFEYRKVTAIDLVGGVITLERPFLNSYLSTLPSYGEGTSTVMPSCGPARIYMMQPDWDRRAIIKGVNITQPTDVFGTCRSLHYIDVTFLAVPDPTAAPDITFTNCRSPNAATLMEVDKLINNLVIDSLDTRIVKVQSMSVEKYVLRNSRITAHQGVAKHSLFECCDIQSLTFGPLGYGTCHSIVIQNCRLNSLGPAALGHFVPASALSNGRFTLSKFQYAGFGSAAADNNWVWGSVYFLGSCLPFKVRNVTDNNVPNITVTDGVFNSTTTITSASAPFLPSDVGLYLKNTAGIQNNTTIAAYVSPTQVTLSLPTTTTGTGQTITINRAMLLFDTTLPATVNVPQVAGTGIYAGQNGWTISPHPCPDFTVRGCQGRDQPQNLRNLNAATGGKPYGSYLFYQISLGTWASLQNSDMFGLITKLRVNVRRAYTGTRPTLFFGFGQFGINVYNNENDGTTGLKYNPCVDLRTVGERIILPGVTTPVFGADTLLNFTTFWIPGTVVAPWMKTTTTGANTDLTSENQTLWPIVEIEMFTDQGSVVNAYP